MRAEQFFRGLRATRRNDPFPCDGRTLQLDSAATRRVTFVSEQLRDTFPMFPYHTDFHISVSRSEMEYLCHDKSLRARQD